MCCTQKEKLEKCTDIPLQLVSEISTENAVTAVNGCNSDVNLKKRIEEANKPIYLKRV